MTMMTMNARRRAIVHAAIVAALGALEEAEGLAASESQLQNGTDARLANLVREAGEALDAARVMFR